MSEIKTLLDAVENFDANSYAILYAPKKCYLALFDGADFVDENGKIEIEKAGVYEARVFNSEKELRWVKDYEHKLISDAAFPDSVKLDQNYLLWGQSTGETRGDWTQFAEARIGAFFVPIKNVAEKGYARFTAVEYLKEFVDGNIAVIDERLTGISKV